MKRSGLVMLATLACNAILLGGTVSVTIVPPSQSVAQGQPVTVDVDVSGLGNPPSVGAFDLTVSFDPALLLPTGVIFGSFLGDPTIPTALTDFTLSTSAIEFAEVSLLLSGGQTAGGPRFVRALRPRR